MRAGAALAAGLCLAACATAAPEQPSANAYADFLIGRLANARQDHVAAADRYFAALNRSPHDEALIEGALMAALASGDGARARQAAAMAANEDASGYVHLVRAVDALVAQRPAQADAELNRVEGTAAEELIGRVMRVWSRSGQGRTNDIVMDLAPLANVRPYGGLFAYQQAMALDLAGRQDEALAAYAAARQGGLWLPSGVERHADLLVRRGAREEAIAVLNADGGAQNPALAAALARVNAGGPASLQPINPAYGASTALYGLAAIFVQESDATSALATLTLASMLDPAAASPRISFAQVQSDLGHPDLARAALAQIARDSPYAASARLMEAMLLFRSGDRDAALKHVRADAAAGDTHAVRTLADMYRGMARYAEAEPLYSSLIGAESPDWSLYFARGGVRERLGNWPEAEADFQRALELSPEQPDVLNYLGYSWVDRGIRLEEGLAMIQRAVELRPRSGAVIDSLGWAYYRMGQYQQALDNLERAVEYDPADPTLNDHLGDVYWRLGRRIEARFQWRRALTFEPDNAAAINSKIEAGLPPEPPRRAAAR